jgi:hypothetical protein
LENRVLEKTGKSTALKHTIDTWNKRQNKENLKAYVPMAREMFPSEKKGKLNQKSNFWALGVPTGHNEEENPVTKSAGIVGQFPS